MISYDHPVVQYDIAELCSVDLGWEALKEKTVLITGATGMLASYCSFALIYLNERFSLNIKLVLLARNESKLEKIYGSYLEQAEVLIQDVCEDIDYSGAIDYIVHAAGGASPQYILNDPVGVIRANTVGTEKVLQFAKLKSAHKVLFFSTREIYGKLENLDSVAESDTGSLDPLDERSCYPESKRIGETLLRAYATQHGIPFNTLRIAHSYGPGMSIQNDGRVLSDFMGYAVQKNDIYLNSDGRAVRAFCYVTDAVEAVYRVMLAGPDNEAYNVGNEREPLTVLDLANTVQSVADTGKGVRTQVDQKAGKGYTNYRRVPLDTSKIQTLGWNPKVCLKDGLERTFRSFVS